MPSKPTAPPLAVLTVLAGLAGFLPGLAAARQNLPQDAQQDAGQAAPPGAGGQSAGLTAPEGRTTPDGSQSDGQQDALSLPGGPKDPAMSGDDDGNDEDAAASSSRRFSPWHGATAAAQSSPSSHSAPGSAAAKPAGVFPTPYSAAYSSINGKVADHTYRPPW